MRREVLLVLLPIGIRDCYESVPELESFALSGRYVQRLRLRVAGYGLDPTLHHKRPSRPRKAQEDRLAVAEELGDSDPDSLVPAQLTNMPSYSSVSAPRHGVRG